MAMGRKVCEMILDGQLVESIQLDLATRPEICVKSAGDVLRNAFMHCRKRAGIVIRQAACGTKIAIVDCARLLSLSLLRL
jgi:hypothetical protein